MKPSTRRIVTRSPARTVRLINLNGLLPGPVEAESTLEADFIMRAALNPAVKAILHQPFTIPVADGEYTPDFLLSLIAGQPIVVEIKMASRLKSYADRFDAAAKYLHERGHRFYVLTERTIRDDKAHVRAELLRRYLKAVYPAAELQRALEVVQAHPSGIPLGTLTKKTNVRRDAVYHLIATRRLTTGARLNVSEAALVFVMHSEGKDDENCFDRWFGAAPWGEDVGTGPTTR